MTAGIGTLNQNRILQTVDSDFSKQHLRSKLNFHCIYFVGALPQHNNHRTNHKLLILRVSISQCISFINGNIILLIVSILRLYTKKTRNRKGRQRKNQYIKRVIQKSSSHN